MEIIKDFEINSSKYQFLTIDQVKTRLNDLGIDSIGVLDRERKNLVNDNEHPITIKGSNLYVNPDWYLENKEKCDDLFSYICINLNCSFFWILTDNIINSKTISDLCKNPYFEEIDFLSLDNADDNNKYVLSFSDYQKFKETKIKVVRAFDVDDAIKENLDSIIEYRNDKELISYYKFQDLNKREYIDLYKPLNDEEINNLKYLSSKVELRFGFRFENYDNLMQIILKLKELKKENKIVLYLSDKKKFNSFLKKNKISYNNMYVSFDGKNEYKLEEYLNFEQVLYNFIEGIEKFSPFERYIYIYNIVKKYKEYKASEENLSDSRHLYKILENEFIVCVGFSDLLGDLLDKGGFENIDIGVDVDRSYKGVKNDEENFGSIEPTERVGHRRRLVHIVDEKYGIDGFYFSDPTWDNDLNYDYYCYLAMTNDEVSRARRYIFMHPESSFLRKCFAPGFLYLLLEVNSLEEFYKKIDFYAKQPFMSLKILISELIYNYIGKLDINYKLKLEKKYEYISKVMKLWPDDISDLVCEIGEYFVDKGNREISGEVIMQAVSNVYRYVYGCGEEELEKKMREIIKINKIEYDFVFPKRYKINEDGSREVIMNEKNKFDIDIFRNGIVR